MTSSNESPEGTPEVSSPPSSVTYREVHLPGDPQGQSNVSEKTMETASGEPDTRTWTYIRHGVVEYPFLREEADGELRSITATYGDERVWPEGPPNDGAWVVLEEKGA